MFTTYKEAANAQALSGVKSADPLTQPLEQARMQQDEYFKTLNQDLPEVAKVEDRLISGPAGDIPIRLVYPSLGEPTNYLIFIRGAGFWAGSLDSHARTMRTLALESGCVVCGIDYRRAPDFHFPVQRNEVIAVVEYLKSQQASLGILGQPVLFGESAGATIALSTAQALRDQKKNELAGLILFYSNAGGFKPKAREYSQWVWKQYLGPDTALDDSEATPLLASVAGLPPIWQGVGADDPLITDTQKLADQLQGIGAEVQVVTYPNLPHGFLMWTGTLQPALDALKESVQVMKKFFSNKGS
jgi:acetyl esterase